MKDISIMQKSFIKRKYGLIIILFAIFIYLTLFIFGYYAPIIVPSYFTNTIFFNNNDFNSQTVQLSILKIIEVSFLLLCFLMLLTSLFRTIRNSLSTIPSEYPWIIKNNSLSPQQQIESEALALCNIEETLSKNSNRLYYNQTNQLNLEEDTNISYNNYISINERETDESTIRYCRTCKKIRPDRSHHCKYCNVCFLKMDHHCFWLDKCITYDNYKFFILTIGYSLMITIMFLYCFITPTTNLIKNKGMAFKCCVMVVIHIINGVTLLFLTSLLMFHLNLVISNITTFEYNNMKKKYCGVNEYMNIDKFICKDNCLWKIQSIYNIGAYENMKQVFGENILLWFIPIRGKDDKRGVSFAINPKFEFEVVHSV